MPNDSNEELEKTKVLDVLDDLNNQILEFNNNPTDDNRDINEEDLKESLQSKPKKNKIKDKIKNWWKGKTKKQRITIIGSLVLLLIIIVVGIIFLVKSSNKQESGSKEPNVIVEEDNYRYENGKLIFLNNKKEELGTYTCENQSEELCYVAYYSNEDDFDIEKNVYQDNTPILTRSAIIEDSYVFISDNPKKEDDTINLYNIKSEKIEETYNLVKKVNSTKMILKDTKNKYGVIEIVNGEITNKLDFKYDYLGYITNEKNIYVSKTNGDNFLIDEAGTNLTKAITGSIKNFNEAYIKVKNGNDKYEVYNYNNQNTFNESYDYIELYNDYAILINDDKMNLKFYDKNKLNEEAISLNNKDYLKTNIYDKDNKLIETKESFSVEENNNIITISIHNNDNNTLTINKSEGILSKSLRNISYFNGKLYIYSDTDKKNLLGSYTCINKNNVTSTTTTLTNCSLASDKVFEDNDLEIPGTVGVIPVFNERFIFINDNPDLVNDTSKTIVLYDLKKNSSLGKYNEVNTYSYTGTNDITFSTVTDYQLVAKNQNGNFGVIKINLTEISGHIGFNYSLLEKLGDYYISKDSTGYQLLSKNDGSSKINSIKYKIRNYNGNYVKVKKDDGLYYIYDCETKTCEEIKIKGYKYIELYDNYYAGVNSNNELGVYSYGKETNLISGNELVKLNLTNYYGNGTLAFKITNNTIQIGDASGNYTTAPQNINLANEE